MASEADLRKRIDQALETLVDDESLRAYLAAAFEVSKQARGWCPSCKKAVMVEINDVKACVSALGDLMNQAKGRPDVAASGDEERIVFKRLVRLEEDDGA